MLSTLFAKRPPPDMVGATLVIADAETLFAADAFLAQLQKVFTSLALAVVGSSRYAGSWRHILLPAGASASQKLLKKIAPKQIIILGAAQGRIDLAQETQFPLFWINAQDRAVANTTSRIITVRSAHLQKEIPLARVTGDPLLNISNIADAHGHADVRAKTAFCERFKEFRERGRWVGYFAATGEQEEDIAYLTFLKLQRGKMGLLVVAPSDPARYEPVYRDAIKYRLPTNRHLRLITSYVPHKTRVYYIEDAASLTAAYHCADFVVAGGTLTQEAKNTPDVLTPLLFGKPIIVGPMHHNALINAAIADGAILLAQNVDDIVSNASRLLEDTRVCVQFGEAAQKWIKQQLGAGQRVIELLQEHQ